MTDMTPPEQAAAEALCEKLGPTIGGFATPEPGDFEDEARAVVAAVRGPLFSDTKERLNLAREIARGSCITTTEAVEAVDRALNAQEKHRIQAETLVDAADLLDRFADKEAREPISKTHRHGRTLASGIEAAAELLRKEANRHLGVSRDPV